MATNDPFNLDYRMQQIEKWREIMDQEGFPKALALLEQSRSADRAYMERIIHELLLSKDKHEKRIDDIEEELDKRSGGIASTKFLITGVLVVIIILAGFLLNFLAFIQGG